LTAESVVAERDRAAALGAARLKSAFLANTTHEIRSPLNVIMGYTELVAENLTEAGDRSQVRYLEAVRRASRRLLSTVEKILDYARLDSGDFDFHPEPVDVAATLNAIIEEHRGAVEEKGLSLICSIDEGHNDVLFDRRCLANVISNPLLNAIKFTEAGCISTRLFRTAARKLKLEITDTGIGIDHAYLARAFEPFSQEDCGTARRFEGVGLGLALTRRCAELNGASVEVYSRKGHGTTVTILFRDAPTIVMDRSG
jgi:signal transduction histidine kinase